MIALTVGLTVWTAFAGTGDQRAYLRAVARLEQLLDEKTADLQQHEALVQLSAQHEQ